MITDSMTKTTKEERNEELKQFCLELARKQSIIDEGMGNARDKKAQEIIDDAEKFYSFLKKQDVI